MRPAPRTLALLVVPALSALALSLACGGSSSSATTTPTGTAAVILTDAPSDQWSSVEVVVTQVAFLNKADHSRQVVAFEGASARVNLVDLDSVGELLATAQIPVGSYDALRITIDPASVNLVKADGTAIPSSQVHVQGASVVVKLSSDLVVTEHGNNAVQLDFDLGHPLFLVQLPTGDWVMNLQVKHRPNDNGMMGMAKLMLRHRRGTIASVGAGSFVLHTDSGNDLTVHVDGGAWFWDADAHTLGSFSGLAVGKQALVSLRMQSDGSLYLVRVWYSVNALPGWTPEGHVVGVDPATARMFVSASNGVPRAISIDGDTIFTFHSDQAVGTGSAALAQVWRGFKVQVEVKDPLQAPLHAKSVNIQRAVDGGRLGVADATQFSYLHPLAVDRTYAYASPFSWWYALLPGLPSSSTADFASAVTGAGDVRTQAVSDLVWNGNTGTWDARTAIFLPVGLPQGTISSSYSGGSLGFTFVNSTTALQTISVGVNPTVGLQPAVLEVNKQGSAITVTAVDASAWATKLVAPTPARVAVVPRPDGSFAAYAVVIFTGF